MLVGLVVAFALGTAYDLYRVQRDLRRGQDLLSNLDLHTVDAMGGLDHVAAAASADLDSADRVARHSPFLRVLDVVPGVRTQVDGLRDLTAASSQIGHLGSSAATNIAAALDATKSGGPKARVTLVDTVLTEITKLKGELAAVHVGAEGRLLPPLRSARERLTKKLADAGPKLDDATTLSTALRGFLAGPRKYLILGGNNAEMRAVGVTTTAGKALIQDGQVTVGDFMSTDKVDLDYPGIAIPQEIQDLYGFLGPSQAYTSAVMTPNFPTAGQISHDISPHNPIGPIDGVIFVDTVTLQQLLSVIGPVTVDGITYDEHNAASELINKNYQRFQTSADSLERRDAQGKVAKAIFDAINARSFSITKLAAVLSDAANGRHLLAWSADPAEENLWEKVGADGATAKDDVVITSQDLGGSKLDYYTRLAANAHVQDLGDHYRVALDVTVINPKKTEPIAPYIAGGDVYVSPGQYGSFLTLSLPKSAYDLDNPDGLSQTGPDGPLYVYTTILRVNEGDENVQHFSFSLPKTDHTLRIVPSARIAPIPWTVNGYFHFDDSVPYNLELQRLPYIRPAQAIWWLVIGCILLLAACAFAANAARQRNLGRPAKAVEADATIAWWLAALGTSMLIAQLALNVLG